MSAYDLWCTHQGGKTRSLSWQGKRTTRIATASRQIEQLKEKNWTNSRAYKLGQSELAKLQPKIDRIEGKETNASVDSELSMVLFIGYDLYRWQPNFLKTGAKGPGLATLMVSRLDGPNYGIAKGLVDKAMAAEKKGLEGTAYIDSRGIMRKDLYGQFDRSPVPKQPSTVAGTVRGNMLMPSISSMEQ